MRLAVFGFIASVFASYLFAHGYDSLVRHDLGVAADLSPTAVAATSDGGLWMGARNRARFQSGMRVAVTGRSAAK